MMRLRSSSRCCSRLIELSCRCSCFSSGSATISGIVIPREVLQAVRQAVQRGGNIRFSLVQDLACRGAVLFGAFFQFDLADLFVDLPLEITTGSSTFRHEPTQLSAKIRQLAL